MNSRQVIKNMREHEDSVVIGFRNHIVDTFTQEMIEKLSFMLQVELRERDEKNQKE